MSGLVRMATGNHTQINIIPGDTVVLSASPIPGNEKFVYRLINQLFKKVQTLNMAISKTFIHLVMHVRKN